MCCMVTLIAYFSIIVQGIPGLGGSAAPGALDFLRNNPQVGIDMCVCIHVRVQERE
jgi:hypothetical protein